MGAIKFLMLVVGCAGLVIGLNILCMRLFAGRFEEEVVSPVAFTQRNIYLWCINAAFFVVGILVISFSYWL